MADNENVSDDLRSVLSQSFDDSVKPDTAEVTAKPEARVEEAADLVESKDETRERGADGKFVKKTEAEEKADAKTETAEAKEKPEAKTEAKADEKKTDADKDKTATDPNAPKEAPARWSASDKAMFKLQTPEAQDFLLRRHAAMESEFTKRNQEIVDLRKEYEPVQKLFEPHLARMKQMGLSPSIVIQRWGDVETRLTSGDLQKQIGVLAGIVNNYKIDKAALGRALGFTSSQATGQSTDQTATQGGAEDPTAQLLATLEANLKKVFEPQLSKIDQIEANRLQAIREAEAQKIERIDTEISSFKSATDKEGNLLHPYFDEVESDMIALAQSYVARKQTIPPLAQLYEKAVRSNDSTYAALLATEKAAQEAKRVQEAKDKAASARRAASSVTGAPGSGQSTRPVRGDLSLREQLVEAAGDL